MAWAAVSWAYKTLVTAAKLQQMVDNLVAHDHRADGTQGAPLRPGWVTVNATASTGWTVQRCRYKAVAGDVNVRLWDVQVTRTGATLTAGTDSNFGDTAIATGLAAGTRVGYLDGHRSTVARFTGAIGTDGVLTLADASGDGQQVTANSVVVFGGVVCVD